jgi:hypothetical protein
VVDEVDADGDRLALVLADHRLPGTSGVDLLVQLLDDPRTAVRARCWSPGRPTSRTRSGR